MSNISYVVGRPLEGLEQFESRGSTVHTHYDGREIQRTFYLRPATMASAVVTAMQGSVVVTKEGTAHRFFPARDPGYPECYCNEIKVTDIDPRAIANSDSLGIRYPIRFDRSVEDQQRADADRHRLFMFNLNRIPDTPRGGCFLTASYRPMITGWKSTEEEEDEVQVFESTTDQRFDWINPHFAPSVRTVPWPDGLRIATAPSTVTDPLTPVVPDEVAQPLNIPVKEFTVKRLFVDLPRYSMLDNLLNTVNTKSWPDPWPATSFGRYEGIPQFAPGTLRFDNYEVIEHASPFPAAHVWYELVYHFSWINLKDKSVHNEYNQLSGNQGYDWVTWNHVFMRPIKYTVLGLVDVTMDLGWYFVVKVQKANWRVSPVFDIPMEVGPLYSRSNFDKLFMLNPFPVEP